MKRNEVGMQRIKLSIDGIAVTYLGFLESGICCATDAAWHDMAWHGMGIGSRLALSPFLFILGRGFSGWLVGVRKGTTVMEASLVFRRLGQAFLDTIPLIMQYLPFVPL